jgi:alpha-tubulin suppressor-like RCC1 family protein
MRMTSGILQVVIVAGSMSGCGGDTGTGPGSTTVLTIVQGDSQIVGAGRAVDVVPGVRVESADGELKIGAAVGFAVTAGGGSLTGQDQITDSAGTARPVGWMVGTSGGRNAITASADGEAVTITAHGVTQGLSAGSNHTCGIIADGAVHCWGSNQFGQLGDGSLVDRSSPTPVAGSVRMTAVSVGSVHTCGLAADATAWCWGHNVYGQLGDNSTSPQSAPTTVTGGLRFTHVAASGHHTCALDGDGLAYCWGRNVLGQLGDNFTTDRAVPAPVTGGLRFSSLTAGYSHTCGLTTSGAAYCWGSNEIGQLGDTTNVPLRARPTAVAGGHTFSALSAGGLHTCGVTETRLIYCWGLNTSQQLGDSTFSSGPTPRPVIARAFFMQFVAVAAGYEHTCGRIAGGAVYCWGYNGGGGLGNNTTTNQPIPTIVSGGHSYIALEAGDYHTCAITTAEMPYCWGLTVGGGLVPVLVSGGLTILSALGG